MKIFMETTKIDADETVAQIQKILGRYGASAVMTEYLNGEIFSLCFKVFVNGVAIPFRMPCRHEILQKMMMGNIKKFHTDTKKRIQEQARRVAWRQILRWIEAQMALVETGMVKIEEVFMPYIQFDIKGQTLFEKISDGGFKGLPFIKNETIS